MNNILTANLQTTFNTDDNYQSSRKISDTNSHEISTNSKRNICAIRLYCDRDFSTSTIDHRSSAFFGLTLKLCVFL